VVIGLISLVALGLLAPIGLQPEKYQWDFRVYYYAASAYQAGINPYDVQAVHQFAPSCPGFTFVYPPLLLKFFGLFTLLPYESAYLVWFVIKLLALVGLLFLWRRYLFPGESLFPYALVVLMGFSSTIYMDMVTGNTSLIEQVLLWTGLIFWLRERLTAFVVFVLLASIFKLLPIAFLLLLLITPRRGNWKLLLAGLGGFSLVQGVSYVLAPELFGRFLVAARGINERGADSNPSLLSMVRDLTDAVVPPGAAGTGFWIAVAVYAAMAVIIVAVSIRAWRILRASPEKDAVSSSLYLACATYGLLVPRFKVYSLILLLPAACYVLKRSTRLPAWPFLLALLAMTIYPPLPKLLPVHFVEQYIWLYYPLFLAFLVWGLLLRLILTRPLGQQREVAAAVIQ
jgi:hypothetical protein